MILAFILLFFMGLLMMAGYQFINIMTVTALLIIGIIGMVLFVAIHEKRKQTRSSHHR